MASNRRPESATRAEGIFSRLGNRMTLRFFQADAFWILLVQDHESKKSPARLPGLFLVSSLSND